MAGVINTITANNATHPLASTAFATCNTAANVVIKNAISNNSISLVTGLTLPILFTYSNTATNAQLSINGGLAYPIYRYGTTAPGINSDTSWKEGSLISFTFVGNSWKMNDYTIENIDTLNTAGATNNQNKLYLIGALSQDSNPQTYSNNNVYINRIQKVINNTTVYSNSLYSNGKEVINVSDPQQLFNKTYEGYTLRQAASKSVDNNITQGSLSTNVPTSNAVSNFVASQIQTNVRINQNNTNNDNNYRILLSSTDTDQDVISNITYKNSHLSYNPNDSKIILNNINEEQPIYNISTTIQPSIITLQAGQYNQQAENPNENFRGRGVYDWQGINLIANIIEEQQQESEQSPIVTSYQTSITAENASFGGNLSSYGSFTLGNTLKSNQSGIVTVGNLQNEDSIKFINNQYEGNIQADLRGVSMGNDGTLSIGNFSYWTGYNPYQIKFNYKNNEMVSGNNPYSFPTNSSILNSNKLTILSAPQGKVRATEDESEYYSELTDQELKFVANTWRQVDVLDENDQPTGETTMEQTSTTQAIVNKTSIDAWNRLLERSEENRYTHFKFNGAGTHTIDFPKIGYYMVIIMKITSNTQDRMYLVTSGSTGGHFSSVFLHNGGNISSSTTPQAGAISDETYIAANTTYPYGAFRFNYTGTGGLRAICVYIWE